MKFKQYMNESNTNDKILKMIEDIHSKCQPFILQWLYSFKNSSILMPLYRGTNSKPIYYKEKIRTDRKPTNTKQETHQVFDDLFLRKYGIRWRTNSIFTTGSYSEADLYGQVYIIFPVGRFDYIYNPVVADLYLYTKRKLTIDEMGHLVDGYKSDNLRNAIISYNEIMITGKEYIAVQDYKYGSAIVDWFRTYRNDKPTMEKLEKII